MKKEDALREIDSILKEHARGPNATIRWEGGYDEYNSFHVKDMTALMTSCYACIVRNAPARSNYVRQAEDYLAKGLGNVGPADASVYMLGVLEALRTAIANDMLSTFEEMVHADVYGNLVSQADALNRENYARAAVVVSGAALEAHLKLLAHRHGLDLMNSKGEPKKAALLNAELKNTANAYSETVRAQVESWQKLRNDAAHGEPGFEKPNDHHRGSVQPMIDGIQAFMSAYPA